MNKEQNIEDILKLLIESVNNPDEVKAEENEDASETMSADDLHKTLKAQYLTEDIHSDDESESLYDLDDKLLEEFSEAEEPETVEEETEETEETEILVEDEATEGDDAPEAEVVDETEDSDLTEALSAESESVEFEEPEVSEDGEYFGIEKESFADASVTSETVDAPETAYAPTAVMDADDGDYEQDIDRTYDEFFEELDTDFGEAVQDDVHTEKTADTDKNAESDLDLADLDGLFHESEEADDVIERQTEYFFEKSEATESEGAYEEDEPLTKDDVEEFDGELDMPDDEGDLEDIYGIESAETFDELAYMGDDVDGLDDVRQIFDGNELLDFDSEEFDEEISDENYEDLAEFTDSEEEPEAEAPVTEDSEEKIEFEDYPKEKHVSFKALMMDYGRSDPEPTRDEARTEKNETATEEEDTPDIEEIISDFVSESESHNETINRSMGVLMSQLGCEDELKDLSPEALGEMFNEYNGPIEDYDEIRSEKKKKRRRDEYKKNSLWTIVRLILCGFGAAILFFYDVLPVFGVEFVGLSDYIKYPGAYVIMGTQVLLLCAVCLWKPMLDGIKKLASFYPNIHSMAAVIVFVNIIYDLIFLLNGKYEPETVPMFHFLSATVLFAVALSQFIMLRREAKCFDIYSSDAMRFTLTQDIGTNSTANKMYSGGFSKNRSIYAPTPVAHPDGFSKAIKEDITFGSKMMSGIIFAAVVLSVIEALVFMIIGRGIDGAATVAMTTFFAMLPISAVAAVMIPMAISGFHLAHRGIALTGRRKIRKYSEANVLVFNDLHLFKKCEPKDVGFVCYEKAQTNAVIAGLQILYSRIGGPLAETFSNVPDQFRSKRIRVRRVARTGVEAVVDKSHVFIVGDADFLRRYGIEFPKSENENKNSNATIYISYDGKASAKISARYTVEPLFDMLIERLSEEGGHCVIETYDPMINTAFVSKLRRLGHSPISVVHKNASDINRNAENAPRRISDNGILAISSRLKLVEAVVWCSRLCKIEKYTNIAVYVTIGLGFAVTLLAAIFGGVGFIAPYLLLLYFALSSAVMLAICLAIVPKKNHFTVEALIAEEQEKLNKSKEKERKVK